jgi:WD40 repeat protein
LREKLYAQLMLALYRSGRQAEALDAYRRARGALIDAIGVEPGPELRRLQDAILRHEPGLERPGAEAAQLPPELFAGTPLAGREAELDWLREQWRRAHGGAGRLALLAGAHGIGKTRLVAELAADLHRDGAAVLYASGAGAPAAALAAFERAKAARRPTLLVLDDLDRAEEAVRAALGELVDALPGLPVFVVAIVEETGPSAAPAVGATLTLAPLGADGVAAVARLYAGEAREPPVARLIASSGGVPQQVHRLAREWARADAARRVEAAAGRAASERAGLREAEDALAGNVVELQAARELAALDKRDEDGVVVCPFKGLACFDVEDARFFFGRERLVAEMVARLAGSPFMGIVGPSGSGKSSALRAGLLPALARGVLPGSEGWGFALVRPGEHPLRAFEDAAAAAALHERLVLAIDQFEEVFTACRDQPERTAFANALVASARDPRHLTLVLVAVRADFYGRCASFPELWRLLGASQVPVGPMRREELRRAIELPARCAGLQVEPELTDALVADVEGEPGALPLLSTSLLELWERRDGRRLEIGTYVRTGGVHGAVARLAEGAYARLDPGQRRLARAILLRLAGPGTGDAVVRSRVALDEFGDDAQPVLAELTERRLLTVSEGEVEVAHEALLREWPRLRGWLEEDAHGRRLHTHLRAAARDWDAGGRDPGELYRGARLGSALDWVAGHEPDLNELEREFLAESRTEAEREAERQRRANRRLRTLLAGVAALLALAVVAGAIALDQRGKARDETTAAEAQRLGARALVETNLERALLLARQGVALDDSLQTRGNLLAALLKSPAAIGVLRGDGDSVLSLDVSPDQRTVAFIDRDGTLTFADAHTRRRLGPQYTHPRQDSVADTVLRLDHVRYSPDGSRLALGWERPVVLDASSHRVVSRLRIGQDRFVYALRFSPDGRTLFALLGSPPDRGTTIGRFDARTGRPLGRQRYVSRIPGWQTLMLTTDGRRVVTTSLEDRATVIRDARTLRPLRRWPVGAERAALSPDDRTMLVGGRDGSVRFLDLIEGDAKTALGRHDGAVLQAAFSADGHQAITAGDEGRVIVWDVERAEAGETFEGHAGPITALAASRDGATLYTGSRDGTVLIWDLAGDRRLGHPFQIGPGNPGSARYALSSDGRLLAAGNGDGTVTLIDARTLTVSRRLPIVPNGPVRGMGFVPRSRLLVVGGERGFLALVDARRGETVKRLHGHRDRVFTPSFSADGHLMATASLDGIIRLWSLPSGRPVRRPFAYQVVGDVSLSPDGRTLAATRTPAGSAPTGIEIFDVPSLRRRISLSEDETVYELARFTPDGRYLVGGSWKGWARLWSTKTWKPATRLFANHPGPVTWQSTSPDGHTLATSSTDGAIRLWDLRTQQPLGAPLPGLPNQDIKPQFTPDGAYLFTITGAGLAYRWDIRPASWMRHACAVAGRVLTRSEWEDTLPERDYAPACKS